MFKKVVDGISTKEGGSGGAFAIQKEEIGGTLEVVS